MWANFACAAAYLVTWAAVVAEMLVVVVVVGARTQVEATAMVTDGPQAVEPGTGRRMKLVRRMEYDEAVVVRKADVVALFGVVVVMVDDGWWLWTTWVAVAERRHVRCDCVCDCDCCCCCCGWFDYSLMGRDLPIY